MASSSSTLPSSSALQGTLKGMKPIIDSLGNNLEKMTAQSSKISAACPAITQEGVVEQFKQITAEIKRREQKEEQELESLKGMVKGDFKLRAAECKRSQIQSQIRAEIGSQVEKEIDAQIKELFQITLRGQIDDSKAHLTRLQNSVKNSEARHANSMLTKRNLSETLAPVLKEDGTTSSLYPTDIPSLCEYDENKMKQLLTEYNLPEPKSPQERLDRFLVYIGITFSVEVAVP